MPKLFPDLAQKLNVSLPTERVRVKILDGRDEKWVLLTSHFKVIRGAPCAEPFPLTPEEIPEDQTHLFSNGSLFYHHHTIEPSLRISLVHQFCIIPQVYSTY
jgi:hypothetical protein